MITVSAVTNCAKEAIYVEEEMHSVIWASC